MMVCEHDWVELRRDIKMKITKGKENPYYDGDEKNGPKFEEINYHKDGTVIESFCLKCGLMKAEIS